MPTILYESWILQVVDLNKKLTSCSLKATINQCKHFLLRSVTTKGGNNMAKATSYQKDLIESLKDPCEAAAYVNAAIEEGDRAALLLALRNVAEANGGMAAVAEKANLSRESLYRMLSKKGNPEIKSLITLLHTMGLRMSVEAEPHTCTSA